MYHCIGTAVTTTEQAKLNKLNAVRFGVGILEF